MKRLLSVIATFVFAATMSATSFSLDWVDVLTDNFDTTQVYDSANLNAELDTRMTGIAKADIMADVAGQGYIPKFTNGIQLDGTTLRSTYGDPGGILNAGSLQYDTYKGLYYATGMRYQVRMKTGTGNATNQGDYVGFGIGQPTGAGQEW